MDIDVLVAGSGNAALAAAASAQEAGARVLVVEKAPYGWRGGNSRFSGGAVLRFTHNGLPDLRPLIPDVPESELQLLDVSPYTKDDFYNDLMRVTRGLANPELAALLVNESYPTIRWMAGGGIVLELLYSQAVRIGGRFRWPHGTITIHAKEGGAGLIEGWLGVMQRREIEVRFETRALRLLVNDQGRVSGLAVQGKEGFQELSSRAVVLACGGFEASPEKRASYLGAGWDVAKLRGTRYNTGDGLRMALDMGAQAWGHWSSAHCSPIDAAAAQVEAKYLDPNNRASDTNRYSWPLGIMVNTQGQRFMDEGEDYANYTYAKTGAILMQQAGGIAYQIYDAKTIPLLHENYRFATPAIGNTMEELAERLDINPQALSRTVREFNESVVEDRELDLSTREGRHTQGITPPKSNWAQKIDTPPFRAYAVTAGVTFTYGGLKVNPRCQVLDVQDRPIPGLYAAGELSGGFFYHNYPDGSGLVRGAVSGRIAGRNAASDR